MMKVVLKVDLYDDRIKQKAMKAVSCISGVESVSVDMKDKKLTLTGNIDPVCVVAKLRKRCCTEIVSVGPAKEEKKPEPNKPEPNKPDDKKPTKPPDPPKLCEIYPHYYCMRLPQYNQYHYVTCVEEDPIGCVIC